MENSRDIGRVSGRGIDPELLYDGPIPGRGDRARNPSPARSRSIARVRMAALRERFQRAGVGAASDIAPVDRIRQAELLSEFLDLIQQIAPEERR